MISYFCMWIKYEISVILLDLVFWNFMMACLIYAGMLRASIQSRISRHSVLRNFLVTILSLDLLLSRCCCCYPDAMWSLLFLISLSFDSTFHIHFCYLNFNFQEHFLFLWMFLFWLCLILVSNLHDSEKNHDFFEVFFHLPALPLSLLGSLSRGVCRCLPVSPRGFLKHLVTVAVFSYLK